MDKYILDTGFFVVSRSYYVDTFPSFWQKISSAAEEGLLRSVDEVEKEIKAYRGFQEHLLGWINKHKNIFTRLDEQEQMLLREILQRFPEALTKQQQMKAGPWADPFVIARAWQANATVVTNEKSAKDRAGKVDAMVKIPDICDALGVAHQTPQEFMQAQGWRF